jgi:hypothetical protein
MKRYERDGGNLKTRNQIWVRSAVPFDNWKT